MLELLLLIPFAAAAVAGVKHIIEYRAMRSRGVEVPAALFSHKPPGEIRMHGWAQRQIQASMDADRERAVAIGRAELAMSDDQRWALEYHRALEASGAERQNIVPGDTIIERSADGRVMIEHQMPDHYDFANCICRNCESNRQAWDDGVYIEWNPGPETLRAIDRWKGSR